MSEDRNRLRYGEPDEEPYNQETEIIRRQRGVDPGPADVVEQRYVEPTAVEGRYAQRGTVRDRRYALVRYARLIYFIFGLIEGLIAIRAVLRLLGANPNSGFASFIYGITAPFVAPFKGLFSEPAFGRAELEFSSLVAIIVYALLAYALVRLLYLFAD